MVSQNHPPARGCRTPAARARPARALAAPLALAATLTIAVPSIPARADQTFGVVGDFGSTASPPEVPVIAQAATGVAAALTGKGPAYILGLGDLIYGPAELAGSPFAGNKMPFTLSPAPAGYYTTAIGSLYGPYMQQSATVPNGGATTRFFPAIGDHDWWHEQVQVNAETGQPLSYPTYPYSTSYGIGPGLSNPNGFYTAAQAAAAQVLTLAANIEANAATLGQLFPGAVEHSLVVFGAPNTPVGADNYETYFAALATPPNAQSPSGSLRWYDTQQGSGPGSVHVFSLSNDPNEVLQGGLATIDMQNAGSSATNLAASPQGQWFSRALAASTATWNIVEMHQPVATSSAPEEGPSHSDGDGHLATSYMQWFDGGKVDLVLAGHVHGYERLYNDGVAYIVNGAGGTYETFARFCSQPGAPPSCGLTYQVTPQFAGGGSTTWSNTTMLSLSQVQVANTYGYQIINVNSANNWLESQFWASANPAGVGGVDPQWTLVDDFFIVKNGVLQPAQIASATGVQLSIPYGATTGGGILDTQGQTLTLNATITGQGQLVVTGGGTLILGQPQSLSLFPSQDLASLPSVESNLPFAWITNPANSYAGGTVVTGGATLSIARDALLGAPSGGLTLQQGTLQTTATLTSARSITLGAGGGTVQTLADTTLSGAIGGPGGLVKTGAATLTLTGPLSYTGGTAVQQGLLAATSPLVGALSVAQGAGVNATVVVPAGAGFANAGLIQGAVTIAGSGINTGILPGTVQVAAGGALTNAGSLGSTTTVAGQLANAGMITGPVGVLGGGTLSNTGTMSGATTVSGQLGNTGVITAPVDVLSGGAFANTGTLTGALTQAAGGTVVNNGLVTGPVIANGLLSGNGRYGSSLTIGGTVAPGNSIGTIAAAGPVTFTQGATYAAELGAPGRSDRITTGATATLGDATLLLIPAAGTTPALGSYTILQAAGGIAGQFGSVSGPYGAAYPFLAASLAYGANAVGVTIGRGASFASAGQTTNQVRAGGAVDALPDADPLVPPLVLLDYQTAPAALTSLSASIYGSLQTALQQQSFYLRDTLDARLRQAFAPGPVAGGPDSQAAAPGSRATVWQQALGAWGSTGSDGNASSLNRSIGGYLIGVDAMLGEDWRAGLVTGFDRSFLNTDGGASNGDATTAHFGAYGGRRFGAVGLSLGASYSYHDISTSRVVQFPGFSDADRATLHGSTAQAFVDLHLDRPLAGGVVQPFAQLAVVRVSTSSFGEAGGAAALTGRGAVQSNGYSTLGARGSLPLEIAGAVLTLDASVGWQHTIGNTVPQTGLALAGVGFATNGVALQTDQAVLGFGVQAAIAPNVGLGLRYGGQFGGRAQDNAVAGSLVLRF
ncbi:MAG: autotransporter domain-containing protein [Rhodospirillales bacterium]|nr:autotransporter domain-containing protein [Rhodospirillales bacterium]